MRRIALSLLLVGCALSAALPAWSVAGSDPVVRVDFSNPGLIPPHWTLTIYPDGSGHFRSEIGDHRNNGQEAIEPPIVDRDIQLSPQFAQRVFQTAQRHNRFNSQCDSHLKVAFEGWKKLSYSGPDGQGACEFNYSKDKEIQALGESLISVATTITEGARLESLLHHDPLGLDKEMEMLVAAAADGRAQQFCAIRSILEHLAADENVLDRVRKRARVLLTRAER